MNISIYISYYVYERNDDSRVRKKYEFVTQYTYLVATGTKVQSYPWRTLATAALIPSPPLAATVAAAAAAAAAAVADVLPFPLMLLLLLFPPAGEIDAPLLSGLTSFIFIPFVVYVARTIDFHQGRREYRKIPYDRTQSQSCRFIAYDTRKTRLISYQPRREVASIDQFVIGRDIAAAFVIALSSRRTYELPFPRNSPHSV